MSSVAVWHYMMYGKDNSMVHANLENGQPLTKVCRILLWTILSCDNKFKCKNSD